MMKPQLMLRIMSRREAHVISHENWNYHSGGSSKYLQTVSCFIPLVAGSTCVRTIVLYEYNFGNSYDIDILWMNSFT
jgi:hypothetical protein